MGHTNSTPNYNLPQFVGTDKPTWLGDINNAFSAIDTAIASAASTATTADGKADALGTTVSGHTTQIGTLSNTVTAQGNTLNTVTALIGNGTPTTTDQTIIGAINELADIVEAGEVSVTADGVKTNGQLLDELFVLINSSKLSKTSSLRLDVATGNYRYAIICDQRADQFHFIRSSCDSTGTENSEYIVKASGSSLLRVKANSDGTVTVTDATSTVLTSGFKYTIVY